MNKKNFSIWLLFLTLSVTACDNLSQVPRAHNDHGDDAEMTEPAKGPHGGRLLIDGNFVIELAIFETGVPPEYRAWVSWNDAPVNLSDIDLQVELTRLGNRIDNIGFTQQGDFLRGDTVIYEPHSFAVSVKAGYQGKIYGWQFDSIEGRTQIGIDVADAFGLETMEAGPAVIKETLRAYGRIVPITERMRSVSARFDGVIKSVNVSIGDSVKAGQVLAIIESNESLNSYDITSPISGTVTNRTANHGEHTEGKNLFTIMDGSSVWAELSLFPKDRSSVQVGAPVKISASDGQDAFDGVISQINITAEANQAVLARVVIDNSDGTFVPGMFVTGEIVVAEHSVPLAVKRTGLQSFRDFTVVYAKIGDEYEVRMLDLGNQDAEWVEVLGGLEPGTTYVTTNSYLVKADIEKSGASHDH
jgi:cobalt-zinc-cadmium efflux system membrane fusion protein